MFSSDQYTLLDFGAGRKLERFGSLTLDRPSPSAEAFAKSDPKLWTQAKARYERTDQDRGVWKPSTALPDCWTITHDRMTLELKSTDFGHLGVFPEQQSNWDWIADQVRRADGPLRVLNLFAYTGASTLSAAAGGAQVTHIDAAQNVVHWARRNAELSGLAEAPIRWICEDAAKFAERELRRGNRYDAIVLDPPSYGHGPKGEVWKVATQLRPLLETCAALTTGPAAFVLLTCHSAGFPSPVLAELLAEFFDLAPSQVETHELTLQSRGRSLPCGSLARFSQVSQF